MRYMIVALVTLVILAGCGQMNPVSGAPEVIVREENTVTLTVQPDGERLITIRSGEIVYAVVLLPPAKIDSQVSHVPVVEK